MKKAILYARHIGYRDYEPDVNEQIRLGKEFASKHDLQVIDTFIDNFDQKQTTYPGLMEMVKAIKKKNRCFDTLIIYYPLCIGRTHYDKWFEFLRKHNVELYITQGSV